MYYMNEKKRLYRSLGPSQDVFRSESSNVFIMLCYGPDPASYNFEIRFSTIQKLNSIHGSSDTSSATGYINSPLFPEGYAQNHEVYEYIISSTDADDSIMITFSDWHLSETSSLYFIHSNKHGQYNGGSSRPVIVSDSNHIRFTFSTGMSLTAGENRDYIGFRAAYRFYKDTPYISKPNTNCKGLSYLMSSKGGKIDFSPASPTRELYDCLWVVKTQEGFDGTYLKIIRLRTNGYLFRGDNQIVIRDGLSSVADVRSIYDMLDNINNGIPHISPTGFYIRLNASLSSSDSVLLTYASYKRTDCGSNLFICNNNRCIDRGLMCDGYDHCGDNSDEVSGCADNTGQWDKSYQYTITIGVIVPMVISVFLIMVICLLFVMIRRCRRARLREARDSSERLPTVSGDVTERRRRRRHRRRLGFFGSIERDRPPTYDEAMQNPPGWYLNVAFGNPVDPSLPQPPSYHEAIGSDPSVTNTNQRQAPGSPTSTDSSQSELTVCSGNLSDSSSSSDGGSAWGVYNGDADGRRGRLGRHVSSSGSETGTLEQRPRSATSPEHTESRSSSVVTSAENSQNRDVAVEESQNVENLPKEDKDNSHIAGKDLEKKVNDEADDFVVPAGPKPGCSDPQINDCRPKTYSSQSSETFATVVSDNHHRNISSGSEITVETVKKPKKKPRKSRSKKTSSQSVHSPDIPENRTSDLNFSEYLISQAPSDIPDIVSSIHETPVVIPQLPKPYEQNNQFTNPKQITTESNPGSSPEMQAPDDPELGYQVVVNVDNDDVIVVYDSADERYEQSMSPSQASEADDYNVNGKVDLPFGNTAGASNATDFHIGSGHINRSHEKKFKHLEKEKLHTVADGIVKQEQSTENGLNCDQTVTPSAHQEGSSDLCTDDDVQTGNGATRSNKDTNQPCISLRNDLNDTEDIYV
ncbi:uncharacterized protein LOC123549412 [Mercenaria mercenaria]|uniref:uncharacterized protein LOC123549412 n=1 Tax=Mercenaria mercenaria TaxID=6596 RepID=UPI00234F27BE|nr:uncharacterized protein LOC123549412 [Mercenaria mercenaria]